LGSLGAGTAGKGATAEEAKRPDAPSAPADVGGRSTAVRGSDLS
jgi:hypothetical protein